MWLRISLPFRFAHHPLCQYYGNQTFKIGSLYLCQGCTLISLGIFTGFITGFLSTILVTMNLPQVVLVGMLSMVPAIIADIKGTSRVLKRIGRVFTGAGAGFAFSFVFIENNWILKLIYLGMIILFVYLYRKFRQRTPSRDLCVSCTHLHDKPACPGLIVQFEANKRYSEEAHLIIEDQLQARFDEIRRMTDPNYPHDKS